MEQLNNKEKLPDMSDQPVLPEDKVKNITEQIRNSAGKYQEEFKKLLIMNPEMKEKWVNALINFDRTEIDYILDYFRRQAKQGEENELVLDDFLTTYRKRYKEEIEKVLGDSQEDDQLIEAWLNFHEESIRRGVDLKMANGMGRLESIEAEIADLMAKPNKNKNSNDKAEAAIVDPILLELAPPKVEPPKVNPVKKFINDSITGFNNWINKIGGKKKMNKSEFDEKSPAKNDSIKLGK